MPKHGELTLDECVVRFETFGAAERAKLILLHCGGGNAAWWSEIAPLLAANFHVVVVELSGHGQSGRRPAYEPEIWAREVAAVIRATDGPARASLVGHSMGALVAIYAAAQFPELIERAILVDPPVQHIWRREAPPEIRTYPSKDAAIARFRLRPPETFADAALLERVADRSLIAAPDGWTWNADPRASQRFAVDDVRAELARIGAPVGCVYGGLSPYCDAATVEYLEQAVGRPVRAARVADAYHHVPLDAPAALEAAIRDLYRQL